MLVPEALRALGLSSGIELGVGVGAHVNFSQRQNSTCGVWGLGSRVEGLGLRMEVQG